MSSKVLYLKAEQNAEVMQAQVCVKDIASVYCSDRSITSKVKALKIYQFQEEKRKRQVISILRVIELIEKECPAVTVESVGENATLIELVNVSRHKTMAQTVRLIFVMEQALLLWHFTMTSASTGFFPGYMNRSWDIRRRDIPFWRLPIPLDSQ